MLLVLICYIAGYAPGAVIVFLISQMGCSSSIPEYLLDEANIGWLKF